MTKTCENCVHRKGKDPYFYYCLYYQTYCSIAVDYDCGENRVSWEEMVAKENESSGFFDFLKNKRPFTKQQEQKIKDLVAEAIRENNKKVCVDLENAIKNGGGN